MMKLSIKLLLALVLLTLSGMAQSVAQGNTDTAGTQGIILSAVPQKVDNKSRYLFYLHGYIVEAGNTRPVSPRFGVYEYEQILETFRQSGFVVISEARKKDPEIEPYARKVAEQVRELLKAGVPLKHITVVGASQGSWIAMLASTYLKNRNLNFVFIAACSADKGFLKMVNLHGNVLSIYEKSDLAQSCRDYRADATGINEWKEVEVNTGLKHGFLYRPMREWTEPTIAWAKR
jgi:pimeloyl-ACP methyl ester carboxylesterase